MFNDNTSPSSSSSAYGGFVTIGSASTAVTGQQTIIWNNAPSVSENDPPRADEGEPVEATSEDSYSISRGSAIGMNTTKRRTTDGDRKISAHLYFTYVKHRLTKVQASELQVRLRSLIRLAQTCAETGQKALADKILLDQAATIRMQELAAAGYDRYVEREHIKKYSAKTDISLDDLKNFPRPIPEVVRKKIVSVKAKNLFDSLVILHHNPSQEQIRSIQDKIIEKDPILFGTIWNEPDKFFFIIDWMDEVCDLTFDKFIKTLKTADPAFDAMTVEPLSVKEAEEIKRRALESMERLKNTNMSKYRSDAIIQGMETEKLSWNRACQIARAMWRGIRRKRGDRW